MAQVLACSFKLGVAVEEDLREPALALALGAADTTNAGCYSLNWGLLKQLLLGPVVQAAQHLLLAEIQRLVQNLPPMVGRRGQVVLAGAAVGNCRLER
jgi:hypothetical protein